MKRFFTIIALALIAATVPVVGDAGTPVRLALSTASCTEGDCGGLSKMDCICPDMQEKNRKPRCIEPGW
ncbi:hypothetical protein [Candidatus Palauibacter sp.]|uniref:hypothetical protein n=1 Tax=Candidatus Palauibacter sp. TaxID=3101350 RepID=UPI003B5CCB5A